MDFHLCPFNLEDYKRKLASLNVQVINEKSQLQKINNLTLKDTELVGRSNSKPKSYVFTTDIICKEALSCVSVKNSVIKVGFGPKRLKSNKEYLSPCLKDWSDVHGDNSQLIELYLYCHAFKMLTLKHT